jgi:hypothetical protein
MAAYALVGAAAGVLLFFVLRVSVAPGALIGAILAPWLVTGNLRWRWALGIVVASVAVALAAK